MESSPKLPGNKALVPTNDTNLAGQHHGNCYINKACLITSHDRIYFICRCTSILNDIFKIREIKRDRLFQYSLIYNTDSQVCQKLNNRLFSDERSCGFPNDVYRYWSWLLPQSTLRSRQRRSERTNVLHLLQRVLVLAKGQAQHLCQ